MRSFLRFALQSTLERDTASFLPKEVRLQYALLKHGHDNFWADVPVTQLNLLPKDSIIKIDDQNYMYFESFNGEVVRGRELGSGYLLTEMTPSAEVRVLLHEPKIERFIGRNKGTLSINKELACIAIQCILFVFLFESLFLEQQSLWYVSQQLLMSFGLVMLNLYGFKEGIIVNSLCGVNKSSCKILLQANPFKLSVLHPYILGSSYFCSGIVASMLGYDLLLLGLSIGSLFLLPYIIQYNLRSTKGYCKVCALVLIVMIVTSVSTLLVVNNLYLNTDHLSSMIAILTGIWIFYNLQFGILQDQSATKLSDARLSFFQADHAIFKLMLERSPVADFADNKLPARAFGSTQGVKSIWLLLGLNCPHCAKVFDDFIDIVSFRDDIKVIVQFGSNDVMSQEISLLDYVYSSGTTENDAVEAVRNWYKGLFIVESNIGEVYLTQNTIPKSLYYPRIAIDGKEFPRLYNKEDIIYHMSGVVA